MSDEITPTSLRLTRAFRTRLATFATEQRISPSAALRLAMHRGLAAMEAESGQKRTTSPRTPRRRR